MKSLHYIILVLVLFATSWSGCSDEDTLMTVDLENVPEDGSVISVKVNMSIPDPIKVTSRNTEYDAIESMTLLCFNSQGKLISISNPVLDKKDSTLTLDITYTTRVIHLIANEEFAADDFSIGSSTEIEIANKVSTAGRMIYWARVEIPTNIKSSSDIEKWFNDTFDEENPISMLRNQAKISISSDADSKGNPFFVVREFKIYNTWNQGTVSPYYKDEIPFPTIGSQSFGLKEWAKENYIRIPPEQTTKDLKKITISDDLQDKIISPLYVYETEYSDNTFILFYGYNSADGEAKSKWWRVALKDGSDKKLNIRRNHHYAITITDRLLLDSGYDKIEDAESSEAKTINDVIDVSPEITSIGNKQAILSVDDTEYVFVSGTDSKCTFNFNVKKSVGSTEDIKKESLIVMWDNEADTPQDISDLLDIVEYTGNEDDFDGYKLTCKNYNDETKGYEEIGGKISIPLKTIESANKPLNGVVKIVYNNKLQRKINIKVIGKQEFAEVNIDELEPEDSYRDPIATLNFTVPETYQGKYPFNVYITTGEFNLKKHIIPNEGEEVDHDNCTGLSLVYPGDAGYPENEDNQVGYKYSYLVTGPGKHSVDMIFNGIIKDEGYTIKLESDFFETMIIENISLNRSNTN